MQKQRAVFVIDEDENEDNDDWVPDKVRLGLNLAFIHESKATEFKFEGTQENTSVYKETEKVIGNLMMMGQPNQM